MDKNTSQKTRINKTQVIVILLQTHQQNMDGPVHVVIRKILPEETV